MAMQVKPLFAPYEAAVNAFLRVGGHTPTVIRSPRALLMRYVAEFAELSYLGANVEEAAQDHVSVRGTTIAGHVFEWPKPSFV